MYEPDWTKVRGFFTNLSQPRCHLGAIGMCAISVDDFDARMQGNVLSKDVKHRLSFDDPSAKCVFRLEANDQNGVPGIAGTLCEVMHDPPVFHHARSCDNHHRTTRT
jgi:hypothetical protein